MLRSAWLPATPLFPVWCCHDIILFLPSQTVSAPEKEGVWCGRYTEEEEEGEGGSDSSCDQAQVSACLEDCCGQHYRPLWAGGRLEEISTDLPRQPGGQSQGCKHLLLGEETACLPPCTKTNVRVRSVGLTVMIIC